MQSIDNFTKKHKTGIAIIVSILMMSIIVWTIATVMAGGFNNFSGNPSSGETIDIVYDPISKQTYSNIDQESEGEKLNGPVYMGFGPLLEMVGETTYFKFVEKTTEYAKENFSDAKYVSLLEDSLKRTDNKINFIIYFNSAHQTNVSMTTSGTNIEYSSLEN